jgi:hypothetical protein
MFVLCSEIVTIFKPKMVTISARNTNIYKICKLCKTKYSKLYNISQPSFAILLFSSLCSFSCGVLFSLLCLKFSLTCKLSIGFGGGCLRTPAKNSCLLHSLNGPFSNLWASTRKSLKYALYRMNTFYFLMIECPKNHHLHY